MRRLEGSGEEWERRKSYLIRSLFEDRPLLSPIVEAQEPEAPYLDKYGSPLPDLIIEPILKRNLYDEPEEFYVALEKEMRRLYRRDFLNTDSDSDSSDFNINFEDGARSEQEELLRDIDLPQTQKSLENESVYLEMNKNNIYNFKAMLNDDKTSQTFTEQLNGSSESITDASNTENYEEVITQADIHEEIDSEIQFAEETDMGVDKSSNTDREYVSSLSTIVIPTTIQEGRTTKDWSRKRRAADLAEFKSASANGSDSSESLPEPDLMRQRQTLGSFGSILYEDYSKSADDIIAGSRRLSMDVDTAELPDDVASTAGVCLADDDILFGSIINTSTPKSLQKSFTFSARVKKRQRRLVPYSPTFTSRTSYVDTNRALQTSFSDDETELRSLWTNFFEGDPIIYKLCSCGNHVCA